MKIITITLKRDSENWVNIEFEDGSFGVGSISDGVRREHTLAIKKFIANGGVVKPFESAEETANRELEISNKIAKTEAHQKRASLLKEGTVSVDGKMWFNFQSANMFMTAVATMEADETIPWYDVNREKIILTYMEAKAYAKEIRIVMQSVYGLDA